MVAVRPKIPSGILSTGTKTAAILPIFLSHPPRRELRCRSSTFANLHRPESARTFLSGLVCLPQIANLYFMKTLATFI